MIEMKWKDMFLHTPLVIFSQQVYAFSLGECQHAHVYTFVNLCTRMETAYACSDGREVGWLSCRKQQPLSPVT